PVSPPVQRPRAPRLVPAPAESGRPEISKEFAQRIRQVVLHGPREGQEGGNTPALPEQQTHQPEQDRIHDEDADLEGTHAWITSEVDLFSHISESSESVDLLRELCNSYGEDPVFKQILDSPPQFKNFECPEGLIYLRENGWELLCIPDTHIGTQSVCELVILHVHSLLAHLGAYKTLSYLRDQVWWKS
ncbi:hypothetical protein C8Q78DRAFT_948661, partial [Trametes maxima]